MRYIDEFRDGAVALRLRDAIARAVAEGGGREYRLMAVSYTHLDVYKRQCLAHEAQA